MLHFNAVRGQTTELQPLEIDAQNSGRVDNELAHRMQLPGCDVDDLPLGGWVGRQPQNPLDRIVNVREITELGSRG